jgi:aminoglycoside 6'-N-acetyltransferase
MVSSDKILPPAMPAGTILRGPRVTLRLATDDDLPRLVQIRHHPQVARWWGDEDIAELTEHIRATMHREGVPFLAVELDGEVIGAVQWYADDDRDYRYAGMDLYLDPARHGQGLGAEVVRTLARHLIDEYGYHRLVIDPVATNTAAIRCYEKVGFRPVGIMRQYWRDPAGVWRDGLLMDLLAGELT